MKLLLLFACLAGAIHLSDVLTPTEEGPGKCNCRGTTPCKHDFDGHCMNRVDKNGKNVKKGGRCSAGSTDCNKGPAPKPPPKSCKWQEDYQCVGSKGFCLHNKFIQCGSGTRCSNRGSAAHSPCVHAAETPAFMSTEEGPGKCNCGGTTPCKHDFDGHCMNRVDKNGKNVKKGGRCSAGSTDCTKGPSPKPPPKSCKWQEDYQCSGSKGFCLHSKFIKCGSGTRCSNRGSAAHSPCVHAVQTADIATE